MDPWIPIFMKPKVLCITPCTFVCLSVCLEFFCRTPCRNFLIFCILKKVSDWFFQKNLVLGFFDQKGAKLAQKVLWKVSVLNISSFSLKGTASFKVFGPNRTEMDPKWGFSSFMKNGQFDFSDNCIKLQKHRSTKLT